MLENNFIKRFMLSQPSLKIIYKLLRDFLFLMLVFFIAALFADGLLPGIISARVGFYIPAIIIFSTIFSINFLAKKLAVKIENKFYKKTTIFLMVVMALLIFNSLIKINIAISAIIFILLLAIIYFTYKVFSEEN